MATTVTVRMYRRILGDCFLITLDNGERRPHRTLIDCGVLQGHSGGAVQLRKVIDDLIGTLKEDGLDVLVFTHEHYDHLSGFLRHAWRFDEIDIRSLWLAWTEKDGDKLADGLRERRHRSRKALRLAEHAGRQAMAGDARVDLVSELLGFMGPRKEDHQPEPDAPPDKPDKPPAPRSCGQAIAHFKELVGKGVAYRKPGEAHALDLGVKALVLGPPRDEEKLRKSRPSGGEAKEVYLAHSDMAAAVEQGARAALERHNFSRGAAAPRNGDDTAAAASPFAKRFRRSYGDAETLSSIVVGAAEQTVEALYFDPKDDWRRIENDWLDAAESLALRLDSDTNNTSLVLALELPDGQVLLFPGDAQVGNWLSWGDQSYPCPNGGADREIDDILRRVTFYKVGHHASHNATLERDGLEKMTDERLVAMIPVDEDVAKLQGKGGWEMPYPALYKALDARTEGRVLRGDGDVAEEKARFARVPRGLGLRYADDSADPLWVEVVITVGADA